MGERRAYVGRLVSLGRWLLLAALVGAAGVVVGRHLIQVQLDERIRVRVRALLADQFRGVEVHVQAARRIEGKGIEIRGIALDVRQDGQPSHRLVYVDELFASCKADLRDLLSGDLSVQQLSVRGMRVCAVRGRDGQWDIARLFPLPAFGGSRPMVSIEGSTVEFRESGQGAESGWALRDIRVTVRPEVQGGRLVRYQLGGTMLGDHFKRVKIAGEVHPNGTWSAGGTIDGLEMSPRMLVALPSDVASHLSFLATLRARAHFEFRLAHEQGDREPVRWVLQGHLSEGDLDDPRLPLPLTELDADVYCDNGQLRIDGVTARSGPTSLELSCRYDEYLSDKPRLHLSARITDLALDERVRMALPAALRPEWDQYALAGRVDAVVNLSVADGLIAPDIEVTCRDVSFAYREFPYPFQHARGVVRLKGRTLQVSDFTAEASGVAVHLAAEFHDPGPRATGWLTARSAGPVPLDETLILALNPAGQRTARMLRPAGALSLVSGRFERQVPGGPRHTRWELDLDACSVLYELFPVPIDNVTGKLIVTDGTWELQNLHGHHGSGYVTCDGTWSRASGDRKGGELTLRLQCADVPLDDALRGAVGRINAGAEQVWADLRPRGTIDHLDAVVRYDSDAKRTTVTLTGEKWGPDQNVEGRSINI
ncbi:MAG: hypothetical protein FJ276_25250, partial [Planctomycetes bacterium]|nr:hypothetical protein [Planctomycetota bacterium]